MGVYTAGEAAERIKADWPSHLRQRRHSQGLKSWAEGSQNTEHVHVPSDHRMTDEFKELVKHTRSPWIKAAITTIVQTAFLDGAHRPGGGSDNLRAYTEGWQRNGWDAVQSSLYRDVLGMGLAYTTAIPGRDRFSGDRMPRWKAYSPIKMSAYFDEDDEEYPDHAMTADREVRDDHRPAWLVRFIDDQTVRRYRIFGDGDVPESVDNLNQTEIHGLGVCPVVRYVNQIDLDGHATSETEPLIPLAARIDQDTFDRLVVQRYGAWKIRYVSGLVRPPGMSDGQYESELYKFMVSDLLVSDNAETKFGSIEGTELAGFIAAHDSDLRSFSALSQVPPYHLLGLSSNMQAESLAAASEGLRRRSQERRVLWGESHERLFRLTAHILGVREEASAHTIQCRWADTEARSLVQTADALSKIAVGLKVPVEMLWERLPNWTDLDTQRAKELIASGAVDAALNRILAEAGIDPVTQGPVPVAA